MESLPPPLWLHELRAAVALAPVESTCERQSAGTLPEGFTGAALLGAAEGLLAGLVVRHDDADALGADARLEEPLPSAISRQLLGTAWATTRACSTHVMQGAGSTHTEVGTGCSCVSMCAEHAAVPRHAFHMLPPADSSSCSCVRL